MGLLLALKIATALAGVCALVALAVIFTRTRSYGLKPVYAVSAGSERRGVIYAFFKGMLPSEKESVRKHIPTFVGGMFYHAGIFAALAYLALLFFQFDMGPAATQVIRIVVAVGLVSGVALLIKRLSLSKMRAISTPDDVIANALVDLFLAAALAVSFSLELLPFYLIAAILLFLYIPLGKIRHCVFFFCTRTIFGRLFGRRGVLPHPPRETMAGSL